MHKITQLSRPAIIGHRGACALAPENTLPSFELALNAGADLIELDYHETKDGIPIVIHDATLDRTTNARALWQRRRIRVADTTATEIQTLDAGSWYGPRFAGAKTPLLSEALDCICDRGGVALIEHKSGSPVTLRNLLDAKGLINHVVVISFNWQFLREFNQLAPEQLLGALGAPEQLANGQEPRNRSKELDIAWLDLIKETHAKIVVWNQHVSEPAIHLAHERGLKVWIYTIDSAQTANELIAMGVDGITTNDPLSLKKALKSI